MRAGRSGESLVGRGLSVGRATGRWRRLGRARRVGSGRRSNCDGLGKVCVWMPEGERLVETEPLASTVTALAWRSDGSGLAATCYGGVRILPFVAGAKDPPSGVEGFADLAGLESRRQRHRLRQPGRLGALLAIEVRPGLPDERLPVQAEGAGMGQRVEAPGDLGRCRRQRSWTSAAKGRGHSAPAARGPQGPCARAWPLAHAGQYSRAAARTARCCSGSREGTGSRLASPYSRTKSRVCVGIRSTISS